MADSKAGKQQPTSVGGFIFGNKIDTCLWLTRVFTIMSCIMYLLPKFGANAAMLYKRTLISCITSNTLRLYQRLPPLRLGFAFPIHVLGEDSCHYLIYCILFLNSQPFTMVLVPVLLFAVLHTITYTKNLLNAVHPVSFRFMHMVIDLMKSQQSNILRFIAVTEIFIFPAVVKLTLGKRFSMFHPFVYYIFGLLRYSSNRNPFCRAIFADVRITIEHVCNMQYFPGFLRYIIVGIMTLLSMLAPKVAPRE